MPTDKIRKYILPNIPYLFTGWACLKLGTAYRLAAGAGSGEKLLVQGQGQDLGAAGADSSQRCGEEKDQDLLRGHEAAAGHSSDPAQRPQAPGPGRTHGRPEAQGEGTLLFFGG